MLGKLFDMPSRRFFFSRLDQMIDLRHPLSALDSRMPRQEPETNWARQFARQVNTRKSLQDIGLFGA